jgi:transcriptional regulator with XRE-family HTH domain
MSADDPLSKAVGARLRAAREAKGLTQDDVAQRLKKSQANLSQYENGRREAGYETLSALSSIYETPVGNFFDGAVPHHPDEEMDPLVAQLFSVARKVNRKLKEDS